MKRKLLQPRWYIGHKIRIHLSRAWTPQYIDCYCARFGTYRDRPSYYVRNAITSLGWVFNTLLIPKDDVLWIDFCDKTITPDAMYNGLTRRARK